MKLRSYIFEVTRSPLANLRGNALSQLSGKCFTQTFMLIALCLGRLSRPRPIGKVDVSDMRSRGCGQITGRTPCSFFPFLGDQLHDRGRLMVRSRAAGPLGPTTLLGNGRVTLVESSRELCDQVIGCLRLPTIDDRVSHSPRPNPSTA